MKQVVAIHGGDAFSSYEAYLADLRQFVIESVDYFRAKKDWKANLQESLGNEHEVFLPQMPNKYNAKYEEWKIWFEKLIPFLNDEVILIGHSLGASFLAKYLSEERFPKKIAGTFLVSGPYDKDGERPIVEFVLPSSLTLLEEQGGKIFLYHSQDDPVVQFSELAKYQAALPHSHVTVLEDRRHVNQESFPEIVADIKSL
jgi:predicted alpha/beta hydrolase family esterase